MVENNDIFSGYGVEIALNDENDFLVVKETLTRMGIESKKSKTLFQSCHILHKRGRYAILHFKELFALDGKPANISDEDYARRDRIVKLLSDWGLVEIVGDFNEPTQTVNLKILPFAERDNWNLESKYDIGGKKWQDGVVRKKKKVHH